MAGTRLRQLALVASAVGIVLAAHAPSATATEITVPTVTPPTVPVTVPTAAVPTVPVTAPSLPVTVPTVPAVPTVAGDEPEPAPAPLAHANVAPASTPAPTVARHATSQPRRADPPLSLVRAAKVAAPSFALPLLLLGALVAYQLIGAARHRRDRQLAAVVAEERWVGFR